MVILQVLISGVVFVSAIIAIIIVLFVGVGAAVNFLDWLG